MMLYLVSQLVITILIDLYTILEVKKLRDVLDERRADNFGLYDDYYREMENTEHRLAAQLQEISREISLLRAEKGVESSAFGLINAVTDFKEVEAVRKTRTDQQKAMASQRKKEWWAKKREEKNILLSE